MPDHPLVQQLLDELLDSQVTPEDVCAGCPEMLPQVRERWQQMCRARADLDSLFRPITEWSESRSSKQPNSAELPEVPGYIVEAVLGVGGMGVVFKARHLRLNRTVALKMGLTGAYASLHERERFQREAEAVACLAHANIVHIYDVGEAAGRPYFTMEYVEGGSLAEKIAGTPQPPLRAAELVAALASAVHSAHDAGIVHRDLKPANILITLDGTPKISDFGLARRIGGGASLTRTGAVIGTPSYMAPEQARGAATTGSAVDVYALGAILYDLLTGRPPFLAETTAQTVYQVLSQDPVSPSKLVGKLPRDIETICLKCLHKEPHLRYESADALMQDLNRFREGVPILARRLGPGLRAWRWSRHHPAGTMLIVTAIAVVATTIGVLRWLEQQEVIRREQAALTEGRALQAAEDALENSTSLLDQGRWREARTALVGAQSLLGASAPPLLSEQLDQAKADAEMVSTLEEIRLQLSSDAVPNSPQELYAEAFRRYGIDLLNLDPVEVETRIQNSAIRDTLLAFLHDSLFWMSESNREKMLTILDVADSNQWRRKFREAAVAGDFTEMRTLAREPEAAQQSPVILSSLAGSLLAYHQREDALALLSAAQRLHPEDFWINYLLGHFWERERPQQAIGYFRAAVAIRPTSDQAYTLLARALREAGERDESITAFRNALKLNPNCSVGRDLAMLLAERGELDEARQVWAKLLDRRAYDHALWHGYPELCLFLGNEHAYQRARQALLDHFDSNFNHWTIPERTSIWCLLRPSSENELRRILEIVDQAVALGPKFPHADVAYIEFVQGLAAYRQGRSELAIPLLQKSAPVLSNRPGPKLVLAMAQFQSGAHGEARSTLAEVVSAFDWKESQGDLPTTWASQVLRREAEQLILPNLAAFLEGNYQPQDSDERLGFLEICQSTNRTRTLVGLYAGAFASDRHLADDLHAGLRYDAACAAAMAGSGYGADVSDMSDAERLALHSQAREWLRDDLSAWVNKLNVDPLTTRSEIQRELSRWKSDPDLAGLRDPAALEKLPTEEQREFVKLWDDVESVRTRGEE